MNRRWANRLHRKADRFKAALWQGNEFRPGVSASGRQARRTHNNKPRALMSGGYGRKN